MLPKRCAGRFLVIVVAAAFPASGCRRSSMVDLPLWRVEPDASGREVRVVQLPFEQTSYDLSTHAIVRRVLDRNQDGISDRIIAYEGLGGARTEETDTDFDGVVDRWDSFGPEGQRLRSATARVGARPDRIAQYGPDGVLMKVEIDSDLDGRFETIQIYESGKLAETRIDSDNNGRFDRVQDMRKGYLSAETFDTDEDGIPNLKMTYAKDGALLKVTVLNRPGEAKGTEK